MCIEITLHTSLPSYTSWILRVFSFVTRTFCSATDVLQTALISSWIFFPDSHPWKSQKKKAYSVCCVVTCAASIRLSYFVLRLSKALFIHVANVWVPALWPRTGLDGGETAVSKPAMVPAFQWSKSWRWRAQLSCGAVDKVQDLHTALAS